jgi:membrane associated rhomboid family serine protease
MITTIICVLTGLISGAAFTQQDIFQKMMHHPATEHRHKEYWRLLTSGFVHADYMHLAFNLLAFYSFGVHVERKFMGHFGASGQWYFLAFYLLIIIGANLPTHFNQRFNSAYSAVGASGGVSGVVFAAIMFRPWSEILFFFIPMPGILFAVLYLFYSSWAAKNANDNIGHSAHLTGAIAGFVLTALLMPTEFAFFIEQMRNNPYLR